MVLLLQSGKFVLLDYSILPVLKISKYNAKKYFCINNIIKQLYIIYI